MPVWRWSLVLAVTTGVCGSTSVIAFDLAREANPPERGGAATGVVNIGGFACAVFADLVIGWVLAGVGHGGRDALGYRPAMAVVPVMTALGSGAILAPGAAYARSIRRRGPVR